MQHSVNLMRDISAKYGIPNCPQSPDIEQNSNGGISDFQISGQSFIKENCQNSRTIYDIDMKPDQQLNLTREIKCQKNC